MILRTFLVFDTLKGKKKTFSSPLRKWDITDVFGIVEQLEHMIGIFIHIEAHAYHVCCVYLRIYYVKSVYK